MPLSRKLLGSIPIPLSGTRKESVGLIWIGMSSRHLEICTMEMLGMLSPTDSQPGDEDRHTV